MNNKKIILPNKKYIGSPDSDIQLKIDLDSKTKNTIEGSYVYTINSNEQFISERQNSDLFRTYLKVNGIYYSNGLKTPFINNYDKEYNTNYYINKQNTINPNDTKNFTSAINTNKTLSNLSSAQKIPFDVILKDSTPPGFNTTNNDFTIQEGGIYSFGTRLRLDLKNTDTVNHNFNINITFKKNGVDNLFRQQILNSNINAGNTITLTPTIVTTGVTLSTSDIIHVEIEDLDVNGSFLQPRVISNTGTFGIFPNSFYGTAQGINSFNKTLSNIDFIYDPIKTVTNEYTATTNSRSVIFSVTAPYDDIIINNISPLTNITSEKVVELLDYWYLPTDIKRNGSYVVDGYTNAAGQPVIVSATTGWINIGTFLTGTTEVDFSRSNVINTPLFPYRGNMNVKIPKHKTYSFFVTVKNGNLMTNNELLKTSEGKDSIAGFMGLTENMATGDTKDIRNYQQYCWLNIWPDSYELTGKTINVSLRDYYGWSNNSKWSIDGNPYIFHSENMLSGNTEPFAFKGVVNYKIVQKEPYNYRTQKRISYDDYFDSIVLPSPNLEYINNNIKNWEVFSMYPYDKDDLISTYIYESGITHTFKVGDGIPAKYNSTLTNFEISATTNTVFNSFYQHNLNPGEYVKVIQVSGNTTKDLGFFPVISVGTTNNGTTSKLFTIKLSGLTGNYIQFKRCLDITDSGSISQYYIRKYKVIENDDNYVITTPLSKNSFGNNNFYLTNKTQIDVSNLVDENNIPITEVSYFFKKKNLTYTEKQKISKLKNPFYDDFYRGRNGFISKELLSNETNFFISGVSVHNTIDYTPGLMVSGLTNTYRVGSLTPSNVYLSDDVFIFDSNVDIKLGTHIEFTDMFPTYSGLTALTQSVVYRKGDDFNYESNSSFSLFSQYSKKPISMTSGDTLSLLGVKPVLNEFIGSKIAGSTLYPNHSIIYINNQKSNFPIGRTVYYSTGSTDSLSVAQIKNYELGGQYATIDDPKYFGVPTSGATSLYSLQYYGDSYNVKISDLMFEHYVLYYLGDSETKINIPNSTNIGDVIYGDIVEYNQRELNTYVLQQPNYMFKLKDLYGYSGSTILSAVTSTYGKTDLLHPIILKYLTNTIYTTSNVEDKKNWAVFNNNLNIWQWRELIPNGDIDESGRGTDFPFLNGRHYVFNDIIMSLRSKYWNPNSGNNRSLSYNLNYNFSNTIGTSQSINDIDIC